MSRVYCTFSCGVRRQRSSVPLRFQPTALELTKYAAGITVPKNPTNNAMDTNQKRLCFIACTGMNGVSFFKMVSTVRRVRQRPMPTTVVTKLVQAMILAGVGIGSGIKHSSRARGRDPADSLQRMLHADRIDHWRDDLGEHGGA